MSSIFLKLLNLSITASWLILVVILVRFLLKKAPKWISCVLWALVAVRLACPFSLESALSLIPSSETIPGNIEMMQKPAIDSGITVINETVNPVISNSFTPNPGDSANPLQIVVPVLSVVWIVGMAAMLLYALISYIRLRKTVGASIPVGDGIRACDEVRSPFILGIIKPVIYIPSSMHGETSDHVIAHEAAHIRRRDHWWKPLGYFLLAVYWFDPLCWLAYILLCRDIESACDERVIRDMASSGKAAYAQALLDCSLPRRTITVCPIAFGEIGVKGRVRSVLSYKKPAFWITIAAVAACIALAVCFLTDPKQNDFAIRIVIPAGNVDQFAYSDEEISPNGNRITLYSGENLGDTMVALQPAVIGDTAVCDDPTYLTPGMPVKLYAQKGGWFRIGVKVSNPTDEDISVFVNVKNVTVRISDRIAPDPALVGQYVFAEGFGSPFTVTLNEDGSFRYYEGSFSSYIGEGYWECEGSTVILIDRTFEDERRTYFTADGASLVFDKARSAKFIYTDIADGTIFIREG